MNFLDACFLCVVFTEITYKSRSCRGKILFSVTFLYINLQGFASKKAVVPFLVTNNEIYVSC
jgi:hypothetical protein